MVMMYWHSKTLIIRLSSFCANKDKKEREVRIACKGYVINIKLAPKTFNTITL